MLYSQISSLTCVLLLLLEHKCTAFHPRSFSLPGRKVPHSALGSTTPQRDLSPEDNSLVHVFDELIASILKVFPDVLRASRPANPDLVIKEPPAFSSPKSASQWGKDGANKGFHEMDQAAAFEAKYLGDSYSVSAKIKLSKIAALLEDIDSRDLLDSLDEYMAVTSQSPYAAANPIEVAEKFIAEGLVESFKPIDSTVNPLNLQIGKASISFHSPVKLSALRKVLKQNPDYFK